MLHGGAGSFERVRAAGGSDELESGLFVALDAGWRVLEAGGTALDAVVEAVGALEDGGRFNAGRGAVPTTAGTVELDAGVMDGHSGAAGAVAAATWPANPIRVARELAGLGGGAHHPVLLAGQGADRFASERGFPQMDASRLTGLAADDDAPAISPHGTVGAVALDSEGRLAAATSTGGRSGQLPGRVGDSPIPGAGVWASDEVAVSATGAGEAFLLTGFGHRVDWAVRGGSPVLVAVDGALEAVSALGGEGGGVALAGDGDFAARYSSPAMARAWRDRSGAEAFLLGE